MPSYVNQMNGYRLVIRNEKGEDTGTQGTAWFLQPNLVVTAFHVVGKKELRKWVQEAPGREKDTFWLTGLPGAKDIQIQPGCFDATADVALLTCPPLAGIKLLGLASGVERFTIWWADGFPGWAMGKVWALTGRISADRGDRLELLIDQGTDVPWGGVSGSAVCTGERVVAGLITAEQPNATTMEATSFRAIALLRGVFEAVREFAEELRKSGIDWNGDIHDLREQISNLAEVPEYALALLARVEILERNALAAVDGWLLKHLEKTEREFIFHMSGMDHLTADQASARYVELLVEKKRKPNEAMQPAGPLSKYAAPRGARLVVLGESGAGKTTSLLRLAFDAARNAKVDPTSPIPIYVKLNLFDSKDGGFDALTKAIEESAGLLRDQVVSLWKDESRSILFLMDGFNEIRAEFQGSCTLALEALMNGDKESPRHIFVITSRPTGHVNRLLERSKLDELRVVELNDNQLEDFLNRHGAASLFQEMGSDLKDVVRNPFLLWALAQSCAGLTKTELPRNKGQLYQNLIDRYLFEKHERLKEPSPTEYDYKLVKKPVLSSLAVGMTKEGVIGKTQNIELLREVQQQLNQILAEYGGPMPIPPSATGILDEAMLNGVLRRVGAKIEFMHQSVQCYFTAVGMLEWQERQIVQLAPPSSFKSGSEHSDGFQAIVMLAGLKNDTRELLKALISHHPLLAAHCFAASSTVPWTVRSQLVDQWREMLHRQNKEYRALACDCLREARIGSEEVQRELIDLALFDEEYEVRTAAVEALEKLKRPFAVKCLVDLALREPCGDETLGEASDVLFKIDLEAAVTLLFNEWRESEAGGERRRRIEILLTPRPWHKSDVSKQLGRIRIDAIRHGDTQTSQAAKEAIELLETWTKLYERPTLLPAAEMRREIQELQDLVKAVPTMSIHELIEHLNQANYVAGHVAQEIGKRRAKEALEPLVKTFYTQHIPNNIEPVVRSLEGIDRSKAVQLLQVVLQESDFVKQIRAAVGLGLMGNFESIALVKKALRVENTAFRIAAATVLGNLGDNEAVAALIEALPSEHEVDVLRQILVALGKTRSKAGARALLSLVLQRRVDVSLDDEGLVGRDVSSRQLLISTLVEAATRHQVIEWLLEAASDKDSFVRATAIDLVSSFGDSDLDITGALRHAWGDPVGAVRAEALRGISRRTKANQGLRDLFEEALKDQDGRVRATALDQWANAEIEGAQAILIESALSDPDWYVREVAALKLRYFLDAAIDQLSQILEHGDADRRIAALNTLSTIGKSYTINGVRADVLKDKDKGKVWAPLAKALRDSDGRVRLAAAAALSTGDFKESENVVLPVVVDVAWYGENVKLRQEAAQLLEYMDSGREALFKPIWDRLNDPNEYASLIERIGKEQPFLPNDGYLYAIRGFLHQEAKGFDKAGEDYETALKLGFDNAWLRQSSASNCYLQGRYEEARKAARKAVEYEPDNAEAHFHLGWYAYKTGDCLESIEESKIALGLAPNIAMAAFNLGLAYIANGQLEDAKNAYDQAIRLCKEMTGGNAEAEIQSALKDINELLATKTVPTPDVAEITSRLSSTLDLYGR